MKGTNIISTIVSGALGATVGGAVINRKYNQTMKEVKNKKKKMDSYYFLLNQWLIVRQRGKTLAEYFQKNNYKTVAIYGMKELGERLYDELKDTDITVKYIIDKNAYAMHADVKVVTPEEELESVDVIVVTATFYFDEIEDMLFEKVEYPVLSLGDILYEI